MENLVRRRFPLPVPSVGTIRRFLKLFPPERPIYVRHVDSRLKPYTDADLFKLISVDPSDIEYCSPRFSEKWDLVGRVLDGPWDRERFRYEEASFVDGVTASFHRSLESHFVDGVAWEDTPFVREVLDEVNAGNRTWTCADPSDVAEKCARVDKLYERIKTHGYMTQGERMEAELADLKQSRQSWLYRHLKAHTVLGKDEVTVNIARDGTVLRFSGKHRLSIAKILDLDEIPVLVLARHRRWQDVRDRLGQEGQDAVRGELLDHPDLGDLVPVDSELSGEFVS